MSLVNSEQLAVSSQRSAVSGQRTRKVDILDKLLRVFSEEQLDVLADVCLREKERAMERRCLQEVRVVLDEKGHPTHLKGSDDVRFAKPREG